MLRIPSAALRFLPPPELLAEAGLGPAVPKKSHKKAKPHATAPTGHAAADTADGDDPAPPGGAAPKRTVWSLRDGRLVAVPVETGVADGSLVEVRGGQLAEGDTVVTDAIDKNERAEAKAKGKGGLF